MTRPAICAPPLVVPERPRRRWKEARDQPASRKPPPQRKLRSAKANRAKLPELIGRLNYKTVKSKIEDMPAWLMSMVVHLLLLLVLALITTSSGKVGRIILRMSHHGVDQPAELVELSLDPVEWEDLVQEPLPEEPTLVEVISFEDKINIESVAVSPTLTSLEPSFDASLIKPHTRSSGMFSGRTGALKQKLLQEAGGTQATEDAVSLGLQWLKRQQLRDGSWSLRGPYADGARNENKVSATAMAMLAFMGAGSTHRGGPHQKELWKAVRWLVARQDRRGFLAVDAAEHEKSYAQAQAMIALCELYAMTGDSWIRPYAQRSCDFAVRAQSPEGGWRYQPRLDSDTSVTGWYVMGLKSGEAAGLEIDSYIWPKVEAYLNSVSVKTDERYYAPIGYAYQVGDMPSPSMTAEGILCRQYMGWDRAKPGMAQGLSALADNHPISFREPDVYYWYYATQSLHHYGGHLWTQWNDVMKVELPRQQVLRGREKGSWSPADDAWGRHAGRLYTTCFSIYCLEVYYRHMPLYDRSESE